MWTGAPMPGTVHRSIATFSGQRYFPDLAERSPMPLVRISVPANRDASYRRNVSYAVHKPLVDAIGTPPADRFHIVTAHNAEDLIFDPGYLDVTRTPGFLAVHITLRRGRSPEKKRALYRAIADN